VDKCGRRARRFPGLLGSNHGLPLRRRHPPRIGARVAVAHGLTSRSIANCSKTAESTSVTRDRKDVERADQKRRSGHRVARHVGVDRTIVRHPVSRPDECEHRTRPHDSVCLTGRNATTPRRSRLYQSADRGLLASHRRTRESRIGAGSIR